MKPKIILALNKEECLQLQRQYGRIWHSSCVAYIRLDCNGEVIGHSSSNDERTDPEEFLDFAREAMSSDDLYDYIIEYINIKQSIQDNPWI